MLMHIVFQMIFTKHLTLPLVVIVALSLSEWVQKWRCRGFSDGDLAEMLYVDIRTIERWRVGKTKRPHLHTLSHMQKIDMDYDDYDDDYQRTK